MKLNEIMEKQEEPEIKGIKELERGGRGKKRRGSQDQELFLKEEALKNGKRMRNGFCLLNDLNSGSILKLGFLEVKLGATNIGFACLLIHEMGPEDHISSLNFE